VASAVTFEKCFGDAEWAAFEFRRAQRIYSAVMERNTCLLRIARPLRCEGCSVFYERVPDAYTLREVVCSKRPAPSVFRQTGQALGELHQALNPDKDLLSEVCEVHGDMWTSNVVLSRSSEGVYLVDFTPPIVGPRGNMASYCMDRVYQDLGRMVTDIRVKYPFAKAYLIARSLNRVLVNELISGYEAQIGASIADETLAEYTAQSLLEVQAVMRGKGVLPGAIWKLVMTPFIGHYRRQASRGELGA